jgi:long-chain fatty acid transport protein
MHRVSIAAGVALLVTPGLAIAQDGGASLMERGTPDMGLSGAGNTARADDAGTAHFNAAGMTRLEQREMLAGLVGLLPSLKIDLDGDTRSTPPGNVDGGGSAGDLAPVGGFYLAAPLTDELWGGFTMNGLYGGSVDYRTSWAGRTFVTEASLTGLNLEPSLGYRLDEKWSVGASFSAVYAVLDVKFKGAPTATAPTIEIEEADDWGYGFSLSTLYEFDDRSRIGARYRSKVELDLDGDFKPPGVDVDFGADMEFPQSISVGGVLGLDDRWSLLGDVSWTEWSAFGYSPAQIGGQGVPIDRDWDDTWRVGLGAEFRHSEKTTLRTGIAWTGDPVSDGRRLPDIPVGETWRFSAGLEHDLSESTTIGFSYTLIMMTDMDLDGVDLPPQFRTSLSGEFEDSHIHAIGLTLRYRF